MRSLWCLLVAVVLLAGWLTARHDTYWDWTADANNSLTAESLAILDTLKGPLRIGAYVGPEQPLAKAIERLVARYRKARPDLELTFIDPYPLPGAGPRRGCHPARAIGPGVSGAGARPCGS